MGESIGLRPIGNNLFNIYSARRPLVGFDARRGKLVSLNNPNWLKDQNKNLLNKENRSGMCPV